MPKQVHQRAARDKLSNDGAQLYETPACATEALLKYHPLPPRIWEPCAGRGAISRVLRDRGYRVSASDLMDYDGRDSHVDTGRDFFTAAAAPDRTHVIITNPPYKDADRFVRHGLTLVNTVIVLLRLAALEGAKRADLIEGHLEHLLVGIERLPMMHKDAFHGKKITGNAVPFAWFIFDRRKAKGAPIMTRRISWR